MQLKTVKGMNDILPTEIRAWHRLEGVFRASMERYCYSEVRTPILEHTELFVRSIGETTDVVEKEMFTFGRSDESLSMRPEGTAGAARAYLTNKVYSLEPVTRWYYIGPMFRAERPQRGRYRQFHQAGCEVYGDPGPVVDAELIDMVYRLFTALGVRDLDVRVNTIGGPATRQKHRDALLDFLRPKQAELSDHAKSRLERNPLRILDSKDPRDQAAVAGAPSILELLDDADRAHWDELRAGLEALGTPYTVDAGLVRGLDYYTRTLFEVRSSAGDLGAQNTLCGGGRYDGMIKSLGGPEVPAIGFALGIERLLLAMAEEPPVNPARCFIAPMGSAARLDSPVLARELRELGVPTEVDGRGGSLKSLLRRANGLGARICLVIGEGESERGVVQLKDLGAHTQEDVPRADAAAAVAKLVAGALAPEVPRG